MKKNALDKHFLVYYRAWRDVEMKGVNSSVDGDNWITMNDIPYGIDIVNVFSHVPEGEEEAAQPFFDRLKNEYVPNLHARNVKVIRGFDYSRLLHVSYEGDFPTEKEFDAHARHLLEELMTPWNLDGIDIDMEVFPTEEEIKISDGVIRALSKYVGPKANNDTIFLYDTNGSNLEPFKNVSDCFDLLAYQQYGAGAERTERAVNDYLPYFPKERFMPGSAFAEEMDKNRWYDTELPYEHSNLYQIADYAKKHDLAGIFLYAIDRDGRTYEEPDFNTISPSSLLWTKTAILEVNDWDLDYVKELALHHLNRIKEDKNISDQQLEELTDQIKAAKNIFEVNTVILGENYDTTINPNYDPVYENQLMNEN